MRKKVFFMFTVLWMGMIFYMSNQPASISTEQSNTAINILSNLPLIGPIVDNMITNGAATVIVRKSAHMLSYAILSVLCFMSMYDHNLYLENICIKSISISFIYACTDEFHQFFVPGRSAEFKDIIIDSSGSIIAICVLYFIVVFIKNKMNTSRYK